MHRFSPARLGALALTVLTLALPASAVGQPADLFFSEYVEGSSNNKALEIYNGTGAAIDLNAGGYSVQMFFNGGASAGLTIPLTGVVAAGDVFLLAHSSADPAILALADQRNGSGWFNGDDAVILRRGTTILDAIGQVGSDPGTEWGTGLASTADNTLRRKPTFCGDAVADDAFDPATQWDGFATNAFDGLGAHIATCGDVPPPPPIPDVEVFEIQGPGLASPYVGQKVRTLDNVVTAVGPDGFFIQTPDSRADMSAETSNGVFVFTGSAPAVSVGDQVDVTATVAEFFNLTELTTPEAVTVDAAGTPLPAVVDFSAVLPSPDQPQPATELERYEGMIVRVTGGTATAPTDRFGDVAIVAGPRRAFREPGLLYPGLPGLAVWDGNPEIFEIDPDRLGLPSASLPAGARIDLVEGPLSFAFSDYQIWATRFEYTGTPALVPVRDRQPGEFTVGSQNLLRLFDDVNDPGIGEPVPTAAQYAGRLQKASLLIREGLGAPDVLAVQEVENLNALQDLAARIQADDPSVAYTAYLLEGNDVGGIDVGFLVRDTVRVDSVTQYGKDDTFTFNGNTALLNDRPPLVLRGAYVGPNGGSKPFPITVVAVHQRSLSGIEGTGSEADRVRAKRYEQALRLSQYLQSLQAAEPGLRLVVTGDFNAFQFSDGYVDAMGQLTGNLDPAGALLPGTDEINPDLTNQLLSEPEGERYSFIFDGSAQALDHSLTSRALNPFVRGLDHVRGNADAPAMFETDFATALRAADHDGLVLFLMGDSDADGLTDDADRCPGTAIPETAPTAGLGVNRWALLDGDLTFDTVRPAGGGEGLTFTVAQTQGCSCEQIVVALGLGAGHRKHGCSTEAMQTWIGTAGQ
ncbi:MAG TPA: lamin tail domain-containing protein [Thermoanaerobaculia bacterium]|nr:lamin tail domain-containing protein [Thermoanaerobaculia bacterium]